MSIKDEEDINNKDMKAIDRENLNRNLDNRAEDTEEDVITETVAEEEVLVELIDEGSLAQRWLEPTTVE